MKIIGKDTFLGKDKQTWYFKAILEVPFSENKKQQGCLGVNTSDVFIEETFWHRLKEEHMNRECMWVYGSDQYGRPIPIDVTFCDAPVPASKEPSK